MLQQLPPQQCRPCPPQQALALYQELRAAPLLTSRQLGVSLVVGVVGGVEVPRALYQTLVVGAGVEEVWVQACQMLGVAEGVVVVEGVEVGPVVGVQQVQGRCSRLQLPPAEQAPAL